MLRRLPDSHRRRGGNFPGKPPAGRCRLCCLTDALHYRAGMRLALVWLAISLSAALPVSAAATTVHVNPAGRDTGNGSRERPFATLARAQAAVPPRCDRAPKRQVRASDSSVSLRPAMGVCPPEVQEGARRVGGRHPGLADGSRPSRTSAPPRPASRRSSSGPPRRNQTHAARARSSRRGAAPSPGLAPPAALPHPPASSTTASDLGPGRGRCSSRPRPQTAACRRPRAQTRHTKTHALSRRAAAATRADHRRATYRDEARRSATKRDEARRSATKRGNAAARQRDRACRVIRRRRIAGSQRTFPCSAIAIPAGGAPRIGAGVLASGEGPGLPPRADRNWGSVSRTGAALAVATSAWTAMPHGLRVARSRAGLRAHAGPVHADLTGLAIRSHAARSPILAILTRRARGYPDKQKSQTATLSKTANHRQGAGQNRGSWSCRKLPSFRTAFSQSIDRALLVAPAGIPSIYALAWPSSWATSSIGRCPGPPLNCSDAFASSKLRRMRI